MTLRIRTPAPSRSAPVVAPTASLLVVDDVPEICALFQELGRRIRAVGVRVTTECNSRRAIERLGVERFDVVVSDFRMREADGVDVLASARAHHPGGYRILMTGYNEVPTSIERIREARIDAYVQKPLQMQDLLLLLTAFLQGNRAIVEESRAEARRIEATADR